MSSRGPDTVQQDYGHSATTRYEAQLYNPERAQQRGGLTPPWSSQRREWTSAAMSDTCCSCRWAPSWWWSTSASRVTRRIWWEGSSPCGLPMSCFRWSECSPSWCRPRGQGKQPSEGLADCQHARGAPSGVKAGLRYVTVVVALYLETSSRSSHPFPYAVLRCYLGETRFLWAIIASGTVAIRLPAIPLRIAHWPQRAAVPLRCFPWWFRSCYGPVSRGAESNAKPAGFSTLQLHSGSVRRRRSLGWLLVWLLHAAYDIGNLRVYLASFTRDSVSNPAKHEHGHSVRCGVVRVRSKITLEYTCSLFGSAYWAIHSTQMGCSQAGQLPSYSTSRRSIEVLHPVLLRHPKVATQQEHRLGLVTGLHVSNLLSLQTAIAQIC